MGATWDRLDPLSFAKTWDFFHGDGFLRSEAIAMYMLAFFYSFEVRKIHIKSHEVILETLEFEGTSLLVNKYSSR